VLPFRHQASCGVDDLLDRLQATADAAEYKAGFDKATADAAEYKAGMDKVRLAVSIVYSFLGGNLLRHCGWERMVCFSLDCILTDEPCHGGVQVTSDAATFKAGMDKARVDVDEVRL